MRNDYYRRRVQSIVRTRKQQLNDAFEAVDRDWRRRQQHQHKTNWVYMAIVGVFILLIVVAALPQF